MGPEGLSKTRFGLHRRVCPTRTASSPLVTITEGTRVAGMKPRSARSPAENSIAGAVGGIWGSRLSRCPPPTPTGGWLRRPRPWGRARGRLASSKWWCRSRSTSNRRYQRRCGGLANWRRLDLEPLPRCSYLVGAQAMTSFRRDGARLLLLLLLQGIVKDEGSGEVRP